MDVNNVYTIISFLEHTVPCVVQRAKNLVIYVGIISRLSVLYVNETKTMFNKNGYTTNSGISCMTKLQIIYHL